MNELTQQDIIDQAYAAEGNRSKEILDWISKCNHNMSGNQRGLLEEVAYGYGAKIIEDDCKVVVMTTDALVDLLVVMQKN